MRIKSAAELVSGVGFPLEFQGGVDGLPFLKVSDLVASIGGVCQAANYVDGSTVEALGARITPAGTLLLPKIGAAIGSRERRVLTGVPAVFDNNVLGVVPRYVDGRYLRYWIEVRDLGDLVNPGALPSLNVRAFGELGIPVSDCRRQCEIAEFLDRECERIASAAEVGDKMLLRLGSVMDEMVAFAIRDLARMRVRFGWRVVDCKHRTPPYIDDESAWPVVSTREVRPGNLIVDSATRRVDTTDFLDLRSGGRNPLPGDVIYSRNARIGVAAVVQQGQQVCMGQDVVLITRRPQRSELLAYSLNHAVADQVRLAAIGSTFDRINVPVIRDLLVPIADEATEQRIVRRLDTTSDALESVLAKGERLRGRLTEYRDALIHEAITGELDVTQTSEDGMDERLHAASEGRLDEVAV